MSQALEVLGTHFNGATAFPQGRGVWRDDAQGGELLYDEPVVVQCYSNEQAPEQQAGPLHAFLHRLGAEGRQGAVGLVIDRDCLEIAFPQRRKEVMVMAKNIKRIAELLGAKVVTEAPEVGGGAWGAARLAEIVQTLQGPVGAGARPKAGPADGRDLGASRQDPDERGDRPENRPPGPTRKPPGAEG